MEEMSGKPQGTHLVSNVLEDAAASEGYCGIRVDIHTTTLRDKTTLKEGNVAATIQEVSSMGAQQYMWGHSCGQLSEGN